jgi:hypothetical protein
LVFLAAVAVACQTPRASMPAVDRARLVVVGDVVLPALNGRDKPRVDVGGLSGAFYDSRRKRLYAVSDDRQRPRVLGFDVNLGSSVSLVKRELIPLQPPPGARRTLDAEGLAPAPNGHWFVSSEGDQRGQEQPLAGIHEYTRDGKFVRTLPLPPPYLSGSGATPSGMRLNLSLEALSASPDGRWLFAGLESSLLQDGPAANFERGAVVRLLVYDLRNAAAAPREYVYLTDSMPRPAAWKPTDGDAGVVDVLALGSTELLVLERGYVVEDPTPTSRRESAIRIYRVRLDPTAEVTGRDSLADRPPGALLKKELVLDLAAIGPELNPRLRSLENFEAIALGPRLRDGSTTVLLLSDDNFSPSQVTALVALRFSR